MTFTQDVACISGHKRRQASPLRSMAQVSCHYGLGPKLVEAYLAGVVYRSIRQLPGFGIIWQALRFPRGEPCQREDSCPKDADQLFASCPGR